MSPLNGRHSEWETVQPPQQAAEVIVATHGQRQGLLTCAGELMKGDTQEEVWAFQNPSTS